MQTRVTETGNVNLEVKVHFKCLKPFIISKIPLILALHYILESAVEDGQDGEKTLQDFTK